MIEHRRPLRERLQVSGFLIVRIGQFGNQSACTVFYIHHFRCPDPHNASVRDLLSTPFSGLSKRYVPLPDSGHGFSGLIEKQMVAQRSANMQPFGEMLGSRGVTGGPRASRRSTCSPTCTRVVSCMQISGRRRSRPCWRLVQVCSHRRRLSGATTTSRGSSRRPVTCSTRMP